MGKYDYTKTPVYIMEIDAEGKEQKVLDHYKHSYTRQPGELRKKGGAAWDLNKTLPLYNDLDAIFADHFEVPDREAAAIDEYVYTPLKGAVMQPRGPHTVKVKTGDSVAESTYGGLTDEVTVVAVLDAKGELTLTASLTAHSEYIMEAVMKPNGKLEQLLVPSSHGASGSYETKPVRWTLDRIVKKEAADEETP